MPRKTDETRETPAADQAASMRPRPDAAENAGAGRFARQGEILLQ